MKPKWAEKMRYQGRWVWSAKEISFLKSNQTLTISELTKELGRTETAVKVRRSLLGIANKIARWTLKAAKSKNPRILRIKKSKNRTTESLISCSVQSISCVAQSPRWIQIRQAITSNGRCRGCAQYKGGSITRGGYCRIRSKGKTMLEHRYVMEKLLGRKLLKDETVHHGPGGRSNNHPENLELRAPGRHKQGWSILEMKKYLLTIPKQLGGLK